MVQWCLDHGADKDAQNKVRPSVPSQDSCGASSMMMMMMMTYYSLCSLGGRP
jgi:hypothetical protein